MRGRISRLLGSLLLAASMASPAGALTLSPGQGAVELTRPAIHLDPSGKQTLQEVRKARFQPRTANLGFQSGAAWIRLPLKNTGDARRWWLEVGEPRLGRVTLHIPRAGDEAQVLRSGTLWPFAVKPIAHRAHLFPLDIPADATRTVYLRVSSPTALTIPVTVWRPAAFVAADSLRNTGLFLLLGLVLGAAGYFLLIAIAARDAVHGWFSATLLAEFVYLTAYDGLLHQWAGVWLGDASLHLVLISISLVAVTLLAFSLRFLELDRRAPRWARAYRLFLYVGIAIHLLAWLAPYRVATPWVTLYGLPMAAVLLISGILALRRGYRPARVFVAVTGIVSLGVTLHVLSILGILPFILGNWTVIVIPLEIPLLALADRQRVLQRERDEANSRALQAEQDLVDRLESQVAKRTAQAEVARERAETANRAKDDFLATMGHELRTPLTTVLGGAGLLQSAALPEEQRRTLESMNRAGHHLLALIDDLLDVSRAGQGGLGLEPRAFDPRALLEDQRATFAGEAQRRGLVLTSRREGLPPALRGDPRRIGQILGNLLANALRATESGSIALEAGSERLDAHHHRLWMAVADTGPGIAEEQQASLFEPFTQGETGRGALGLGLSIARALAEAMDGRLELWESGPGGSRFVLTLELAEASAEGLEQEATPQANGLPAPRHFLLVEDDPDNRVILARLLEGDGHRITPAREGGEALRLLGETAVDTVLTDLHLPDMDGFELTRHLRQQGDANKAGVPVLAVTASATPAMHERAREAGMDGLIPKPLDPQCLYATLAEVLAEPAPPPEASPSAQHEAVRAALSEAEWQALLQRQQEGLHQGRRDLNAAVDAGDPAAVARAAHRMAGAAALLGDEAILARGRDAEDAANRGDEAQWRAAATPLLDESPPVNLR